MLRTGLISMFQCVMRVKKNNLPSENAFCATYSLARTTPRVVPNCARGCMECIISNNIVASLINRCFKKVANINDSL